MIQHATIGEFSIVKSIVLKQDKTILKLKHSAGPFLSHKTNTFLKRSSKRKISLLIQLNLFRNGETNQPKNLNEK